ncbi:MAG TPA: SIMPL domain-containing protein [Pirellulaceae bacterium]|nr:SIMPL domain-containing protein [Pirellulaceae bacterium]
MRTIATACFWVILAVPYCSAQLSINPDWRERNGLTVASSQTVSVPAKTLRGFVTLESVDVDLKNAVANVSAKKKTAVDALKTIGVPENSIRITSTRIPEWDTAPRAWNVYGPANIGLVPTTDSEEYKAVAYLSFDMPLAGMDPDELIILPHDTCKRLKKQAICESSKIVFLYVGELTDAEIKDATKKAYDEALANAKSTALFSGRSLGKLAALTPEMNGPWRYWSEPTYGYWQNEAAETNPLSNFRPAENEVFGNDASRLSRTYSVELRFNIE